MNYMLGNSVITTILLIVCSYLFKYCNWYRLIVISNLLVLSISTIDNLFRIPINNLELLILYYVTYMIFIFIIIIIKFKCNEKVSKESIVERTKFNNRKN